MSYEVKRGTLHVASLPVITPRGFLIYMNFIASNIYFKVEEANCIANKFTLDHFHLLATPQLLVNRAK
jgi:hypothetical protein